MFRYPFVNAAIKKKKKKNRRKKIKGEGRHVLSKDEISSARKTRCSAECGESARWTKSESSKANKVSIHRPNAVGFMVGFMPCLYKKRRRPLDYFLARFYVSI